MQLIFYTIQFILCNLTNIPLALKSTRDKCATQKCSSKDTGKATALIGRMTTVFTWMAFSFWGWLTLDKCDWFFRYKYEWKLEEAKKNILRTHTTAVSARMLYKLAQQVLSILKIVLLYLAWLMEHKDLWFYLFEYY